MNIRNYGIDLLRIISITMITILHIIVPGMGQYSFYNGTLSIKIIYAICACGVNCFLLISGYVNLNTNYKFSRLIKLLLEAVFYNLILTIIISVSNNTLSLNRIFESIDILENANWWFLRAYIILFLLIPIINSAVNHIDKKTITISLLLLVFFVCVCGVIKGDVFYSGNGYSAFWFIIVYMIGAYIKKYKDNMNMNKFLLLIIFILSVVVTTVSFYILFNYNGNHLDTYIPEDIFYQYTSPTILINSVVLLLLFKDIKINKTASNIMRFFTPSIFAVYLFQCQHYIYKYYFPDRFAFLNNYNNLLFIYIPLIAIVAVIALLLLDQIRVLLSKLFKLNHLYDYIDAKINSLK